MKSHAKTNIAPSRNPVRDEELNFRGPQLVSPEPSAGPEAITAHEIALAAWQQFCFWLTQQLKGVETTIERLEGNERSIECLDRTLEKIEARDLADGVNAVLITVAERERHHVIEVAGPSFLRLHANAAGWPRVLEIGYEEGRLLLNFTHTNHSGETFTANSWGE
jgi:hypothetical protein